MIGISDYAQDKLGEVTFADLPDEGTTITRDGMSHDDHVIYLIHNICCIETFGALESVKAAADLYSPLSGTVTKVNTALEESSDIINRDPYGEGTGIKTIRVISKN